MKCRKATIVGIHERHFTTRQEVEGEELWLRKHGYSLSATVAAGQARGTAAVVWETKTWTLVSKHDLGERLRAVVLKHAEGGHLQVLCGHMHHDARRRENQSANLKPRLAAMPDILRLFLMDCNSLIVPSADSLYANDVEPKMIRSARQMEVQTL